MPFTYTPLRYPGGKTKLYTEIRTLLTYAENECNCKSENSVNFSTSYLKEKQKYNSNITYIEPFAGGAGLALKLLFCNDVKNIILNDIDVNIYLFWQACLNQTDELCNLVDGAVLSIKEWERQRTVLSQPSSYSDLQRAFALFYLNRCNRSGIIKGGLIGGKEQQGKYKMDARFNKEALVKKIKAVGNRKEAIAVYCMDGKDFLQKVCKKMSCKTTFINIDPPYVNKGPELYQNSFCKEDHVALSKVIKKLKHNWVVTYDVDDLIKKLYDGYETKKILFGYSAGNKRKVGEEYLITNIDIN